MLKEPTLLALWGAALGLGLVGYWAARFRRVLVLPVLAAIVYLAWSRLGALVDPVAGPAVIQRVGYGYLVQACAAVALAVVLSLMGLAPKRSAG
jgi:hypothetical protein